MSLSSSIPNSVIKPGVCTSTTRPANPYEGQVIYETDTDYTLQWSGTGWVVLNNFGQLLGRRNCLDNGDNQILQPPMVGGFSGSTAFHSGVDRWIFNSGSLGSWTEGVWTQGVGVDVTGAEGEFPNRAYMLCTAANASPGASTYVIWDQRLMGRDIQHWRYGTAGARSVTFSGWIFLGGSPTGLYYMELVIGSGSGRFVTAPMTLTSNVWQYKTVTFPPNTVDVITNDNNTGASLRLWMGAGSNYQGGTWDGQWGSTQNKRVPGQSNCAATLNNYIVKTGWQLEVGSVATSFEHVPYSEMLQRCQVFYWKSFPQGVSPATNAGTLGMILGQGSGDTVGFGSQIMFQFPANMRGTPSMTFYNPSAASNTVRNIAAGTNLVATAGYIGEGGGNVTAGTTAGGAGQMLGVHIVADARL